MAKEKKLTHTDILKHYLLKKDNPYLLDDNNNGKTIMLSGAWGSGKTHFWKEEIEREQKKIKIQDKTKEEDKYTLEEYNDGLHSKLKNNNKACIYVSLYGKTSIESIELDLYMKAYQNIVGDADFVSKTCSVFTNLGKNLGNMAHKGAGGMFSWMENLVDKDKFNQAGEYLKDGGVICFDDFERKSKDINLNDLFGFISQLVIEYNCKVMIVLNSDVFKDEEADIFKRVKEKTISKFFYFNPTIEELFKSISDNPKYNTLNEHKADILSAIKETEELNARIYTQVLDNCLEWLDVKIYLNNNIIRVLVLSTFNFVLHHLILDYQKLKNTSTHSNSLSYKTIRNYNDNIQQFFHNKFTNTSSHIIGRNAGFNRDKPNLSFIEQLSIYMGEKGTNKGKQDFEWFLLNKSTIEAIYKYGYQLYYFDHINEEKYDEISEFINTGILLP